MAQGDKGQDQQRDERQPGDLDFPPACFVDRPGHPARRLRCAVDGPNDHHDGGDRLGHRSNRDAEQQQSDRRHRLPPGQDEHCGNGQHRPDGRRRRLIGNGHDKDVALVGKQHQEHNDAERRAIDHPEHAWRRQFVPRHPLQQEPRHRNGAPGQNGKRHARHAQIEDDDGLCALAQPGKRPGDIGNRHPGRTQRDGQNDHDGKTRGEQPKHYPGARRFMRCSNSAHAALRLSSPSSTTPPTAAVTAPTGASAG